MADFIAKAIKHPGAFSAKAKAAGKSTAAYAKKEKNSKSPVTAKQANLAITLMKMNKKKAPPTPAAEPEGPAEDMAEKQEE